MLTELCSRHAALATGPDPLDQVTVVFDAGQNSQDNFTDLRARKIGYVTSLPPSDHPDLLALPGEQRIVADPVRYPGLTALKTRMILTHSSTLHAGQSRGLDQTLAKTQAKLSELADRLVRGKTRRARPAVTAEITAICKDSWVKRILVWDLTGEAPADLRLTWQVDEQARTDLESEVFGKRVLVTNRETWPITDAVATYRSQTGPPDAPPSHPGRHPPAPYRRCWTPLGVSRSSTPTPPKPALTSGNASPSTASQDTPARRSCSG